MIGWYLALGVACSVAVFFFHLWIAANETIDEMGWAEAEVRVLGDQRRELEGLLADARIERDMFRDELAKLKAPKKRGRKPKAVEVAQ
jgi:hypothetical protein